mmetsp:Transcript_10546/g.18661  ORF Transcript_10546/g.18661 Transcript_10546/m.18661 type:complete len:128 (-) Transcript_10546:37-420(-)|eukprot:CAMPEP_0184550596 /NCGR_PEP_ID=MMETSP0199_2-20130426/20972_1 /TAXON_ID=1112570 /ORGANISM="Thraustochytrium sp., Strain LLF1b" /LENGTH=127 /DNA_ID=CAMNT_0026945523 /DNA_START=390 /DNA_END=773 /DNA_ORIENTATION=-
MRYLENRLVLLRRRQTHRFGECNTEDQHTKALLKRRNKAQQEKTSGLWAPKRFVPNRANQQSLPLQTPATQKQELANHPQGRNVVAPQDNVAPPVVSGERLNLMSPIRDIMTSPARKHIIKRTAKVA